MQPNRLFAAAVFAAVSCAHTREMTAPEHRAEAARHQQVAANEEARFDARETRPTLAARSPFIEEGPGLELYNPSAAHLNEADRQMRAAFEHLQAAQQLEKFEDVACAGISVAERIGCPLLAPHVQSVEEVAQGLVLHLKPTAPAKSLAAQMRCHLAYAMANGFDRAPCPLYVKGVKIALNGERSIDVRSPDARVAGEVRLEARKLFGEPASAR
jgi:hypothetical protein